MSVYSDDAQYRRNREALKRQTKRTNAPCWLCGKPFDWSVDQERDPMSFTADHLLPIAKGGRMGGALRPAHRACNSRRGDGSNKQRPAFAPVRSTIDWLG